MKYIITGSSGFIGSHIVDLLKKKKRKYLCIDKLNNYKIENYLKSDLTDLKKLEKLLKKMILFYTLRECQILKIVNQTL